MALHYLEAEGIVAGHCRDEKKSDWVRQYLPPLLPMTINCEPMPVAASS